MEHDAARIREYATPLHKRSIADLTRDDVLEVLKPIWTKIPELLTVRDSALQPYLITLGRAAFTSKTIRQTGAAILKSYRQRVKSLLAVITRLQPLVPWGARRLT